MKARLIKKLSKKLVESAPKIFHDAWVCDDVLEEAWNQGSRVSHVWHVGGGLNYWGEGEDACTALEFFKMDWYYFGDFPIHDKEHEFYGYPDTGNFKPTSRNLLKLAREHG